MLKIVIPAHEIGYNDDTSEFIFCKEYVYQLEHSLISISKWESRWKKAFFGNRKKTNEELLDYIKCMVISKHADDEDLNGIAFLTVDNIKQINAYIEDPMTASNLRTNPDEKSKSKDVMTSELIYYLMIAYKIPFECQKWHINRLLMLIRIAQAKERQAQRKSKTPRPNAARRHALNASRLNGSHGG